MELGVLGPLQVRLDGAPVAVPGAKPRAILTMLGLHGGSVVPADVLMELLWGDDPPRTAAKALQTHISSLRHTLGDGFVLTEGTGWRLNTAETDAARFQSLTKAGRDALAAGDTSAALIRFDEAASLWRGVPELPDGRRGVSEKTRWIEAHAALVEDRADALLATGRAAEVVGDLEAAVADAPLRERRWGQLMLALYRAGRQGEALGAYRRARSLLADELGVDPGPELRRLEAAIVAQDTELDIPAIQHVPSVTRAVTFLLTDIEGSTAAWEADADAMAVALARHDELVEQIVTSRGGRLIKTRGEGDATFSVFDRPSAAAAAAIELQDAIFHEPWAPADPMRIRVALHTGEAELRDGDYFGRAVNRAARLRSLASGGQTLCSGGTAELVIDSLPDDVALADLGMRQLKNLTRPEHVFELRLQTDENPPPAGDTTIDRPMMPTVLGGPGPFVGRNHELAELVAAWQSALTGGTRAVLIAGEPGVGKTRLAGEWGRQAYEQGAVVLYGRSDEDLGAPYQPFAEALRTLVPCIGTARLRGLRGVEALLPLVPGLSDVLPDLAAPPRGDPDTERYALFDAVVALLGLASVDVPIVLVLDDLHWAAKPTLLLLRHLLRFGEHARVQIIGTYRSTDLDRSHPLAAMLAHLHRDGSANRIALGGLDEDDVSAFVAEAGYDDEELARALASVTGGNPFFLIEALRHVEESGGHWDPSTLPQGVREAVSRRLSRLPAETNKALAAAAVVGSQFSLDLVEHVIGQDLVDAFDEACQAGIVIEEPGGLYRFNHAIVRQSLLAELASVRRMRLHQRIATTLETMPGADAELLSELAHHYFECAWAGNALKAVEYCRRAADQAMARLAYEGAADLYDHALHALDELDDELPDRDDQRVELLVARCEALLAAGDVSSATSAVSQLKEGTRHSARLAAWATCFEGQLSMLVDPERLDEIECAVAEAAVRLAELHDAAGEAKAHTVRAGCLARLGHVADCELALDNALTAARQAREHRLVNAVLAGAPLAALWGPNPVPRAGGRCLDVVRLLRITTDSPAVEATSTRCQAVLEAFRGRAAAARRMIDSAARTVTDLGLRHALLEVDHFAGIVELVLGDPAAAELHLRLAYNGFRRMGLDADTAESAALLARACLWLDRDVEADELCSESERLAGHALKASIAWRTVRAQLLSRAGAHAEARRVAEEAVAIAERTDALVDHGDACLALATVLGDAGDVAGARAAAERAADLYGRKGAVALVEKACRIFGHQVSPAWDTAVEAPVAERDNQCLRVISRLHDAVARGAWAEVEPMLAPNVTVENRRRIVGFERVDCPPGVWVRSAQGYLDAGVARIDRVVLAVRGERLALFRLTLGTVDGSPGAPQDELLRLMGIDEDDRVCLHISFDLDDIDAAMAELDAQHARFEALQLNAKSQVPQRYLDTSCTQASGRAVAAIDAEAWDEFEEVFAPEGYIESRRKLVGFKRTEFAPRDVVHQTRCDLENGVMRASHVIIAVRGERLALARLTLGTVDESPGAPRDELLQVYSIDEGGRIAAQTWFDVDDMDAALAELDARYLAGDAAPYSETWSVISRAFATLNRREVPPISPDWVNIDHRRGTGFATGDQIAYIQASWQDTPDIRIHPTVVHRLTKSGAVVASIARGTSDDGFDAEWKGVELLMVDGELITRCEIFDESDLDAALARFDELGRRPENTASRVYRNILANFAVRNWNAIREILAEDISTEDRRRVVNAGRQQGRDAVIAEISSIADVGVTKLQLEIIATRGGHLALSRCRASATDQRSESFRSDLLDIIEVNADNQVLARIVFDPDDFDAAFEELDARYLAGEAAACAQMWSVIARNVAAFNRREPLMTTQSLVTIDHRRATAFEPGDITPYIHATWDVAPDINLYIEAVHRHSDSGALFTQVLKGTSQEGFDAEWRDVIILTVDGEQLSSLEVFDEADLDSALARFNELSRPAQPSNAASRTYERLQKCFIEPDLDAMEAMLADNMVSEDRRHIVSTGIRRGRDAALEDARAVAGLGVRNTAATVIATRGERLALRRSRYANRDEQVDGFHVEILEIIALDDHGLIAAVVTFDSDDFDAALKELDARYLAGEAATHTQTWSTTISTYAALNRHQLPAATPNWTDVDHRRTVAIAAGGLGASLRAIWDITTQATIYVEAVHRLSDVGVVVTHMATATSQEGFDAEWRDVCILTVEGDRIRLGEVFDEADLDAALARFDELIQPVPRLCNSASRIFERIHNNYAAGDWEAVSEALYRDAAIDDRRRFVGDGSRHGRDAVIAHGHAVVDVGLKTDDVTTIAIRGDHLALTRVQVSKSGSEPDRFSIDDLQVVEIDANERILAIVVFDLDDIDSALAELDARYLAGEASAYAHTWSVITRTIAAANRHELPSTTPDWVNIDHHRATSFEPGGLNAYIRSSWDDMPEGRIYVESVHRLSGCGAVITHAAEGATPEGFEADWRGIDIMMVEGDLISRSELFEESDRDAALARFDELSQQPPT
ncbi:BTAD domain-containing putative transcriptional regulator [Mycobacterium sp. NPDC049093]